MLQEPGPNQTIGGMGRGRRGTKRQRPLLRHRHAPLRHRRPRSPTRPRRAEIEKRLDAVEAGVAGARRRLSTPDLPSIVPAVALAVADLRAARALVREGDGGTAMLLDEKLALAQAALAAAAEVTLDAICGARNGGAGRVARNHGLGLERRPGRRRRRERRPRVAGRLDDGAAGRRGARRRVGQARGVEGAGDRARGRARDRPLLPRAAAPGRSLRLERGARPPCAAIRFSRPPSVRVARLTIAGERVVLERDVVVPGARPGDRRGPPSRARRPGARDLGRAGPAGLAARPEDEAPRGRPALERRRPGLRPARDRAARGMARARAAAVHPRARPATASSSTSTSRRRPRSPPAGTRSGFAARLDDGTTAQLGIRLIDYGYIPRTPMPEVVRGRDLRRRHPLPEADARRLRPGSRGSRARGAHGRRPAGRDPDRARPRGRRPLPLRRHPGRQPRLRDRSGAAARQRRASSTTRATAGSSSSSTSSTPSSRAASRRFPSRSRGRTIA